MGPASTDYAKFSPLTYVANVQTPLMILHAENDTRAPIDQTLQEFTSLKIWDEPWNTWRFPTKDDLSRTGSPIHRVERLHLIVDLLKKYLQSPVEDLCRV